MELLKQNNKKLKKDIREVGCFFRAALALSEIKENKKLIRGSLHAHAAEAALSVLKKHNRQI